jgi:hypothetical protein
LQKVVAEAGNSAVVNTGQRKHASYLGNTRAFGPANRPPGGEGMTIKRTNGATVPAISITKQG